MSQQCRSAVMSPSPADRTVFDRWAQVYDDQANPLLMLEERYLTPMLPSIVGRDVLDVGCGTGRWLRKLELLGPSSLMGIDCSPAMLGRARDRVHDNTQLLHADCSAMSCEDNSKTLVLASFVLSYVDSLMAFARECCRVVSPGGWLLICDMHPVTALERDWKRSFRVADARVEIPVPVRRLDEIVSAFEECDFVVDTQIQPSFELPERSIFESTNKTEEFEELAGVPAIYILKLKKRIPSSRAATPAACPHMELTCSHIATGPNAWRDGTVEIAGDRIASSSEAIDRPATILDLSGYSLLPGLINAHDHLEFGLFPPLGRTGDDAPYQNSIEWAQEIHVLHATAIQRHDGIPKSVRLWWGAIRNLLCGVTTVCHHNPLDPEFELPGFPLRVVSRFGWAHSLAFDEGVADKFCKTPTNFPFIIHAAEGVDDTSLNEVSQLDDMQMLDERTILVHALALNQKTAALVNRRGASVVTCPTSNLFLFGRTLSLEQLASIERVALGSDSPITAAGDLLDEIQCLRSHVGLDPETIYSAVTSNAAGMFRLGNGEGQIAEGGVADLIAVRGHGRSPAITLTELTFDQVEMVLLGGRVQMASEALYARLSNELRSGMELLSVADQRRWLRAPLRELYQTAQSILGGDGLFVGGRQVSYAGAI